MTEARAQLYETAVFLLEKVVEFSEAPTPDPVAIATAATAAKEFLQQLRDVEARRPRRAWERAMDRHHLSLVREA